MRDKQEGDTRYCEVCDNLSLAADDKSRHMATKHGHGHQHFH